LLHFLIDKYSLDIHIKPLFVSFKSNYLCLNQADPRPKNGEIGAKAVFPMKKFVTDRKIVTFGIHSGT